MATIAAGSVKISASSGLPAQTRILSGPATASGDTVTFTGLGTVEVLAWHPGDEEVWNAAPPEQFTLQITKNPASINLTGLSRTYDGGPKAVGVSTTPPGLVVNLSYNGDETAPTAAGSYTVSAVIDDPLYEGSATGTLVIAKAPQTIDFGPISHAIATDEPTLSATGGGSGNTVTFAVTNGPAVIGPGNALSFTGAGTVTITASQAGDTNHLAATPLARTFQVSKAPASVLLTGLSQTYSGTPRLVSATTNPGGLAVDFTYGGAPGAPIQAGSYEVVGTIADARYQGSATGTLVVGKAAQAIGFASVLDQLANAEVMLTATGGGSGNPVEFSVTDGPASIGSENRLTFTGEGVVTIIASQAGDVNHLAADEVVRTFTVTKATASVVLSGLAQVYDGSPRIPDVSTDPTGLNVNFTYNDSPAAPVNAGTYAVIATVVDARYQGITAGDMVVAKATQTIDFAPISNRIATEVLTLSASGGGSGKPVTFSVVGPAQLSGHSLSFTGAGEVSVTAEQEGDANFSPAGAVTHTFTVAKAAATVTLSSLHQVHDGTPRVVVVETAPPGLTVDLTYAGEEDVPSAVGRYEVVATINDARHEGGGTGELVIDDPARMVMVEGGGLPALSSLGDLNLRQYQIGAHEVTWSFWNLVRVWAVDHGYDLVDSGAGCSGDHPVREVDWIEAVKWCNARTEWENALLGRALDPAYRVGSVVLRTGIPASPGDVTCDFGTSGYRLPTAEEWEFAARGGAASPGLAYPGGNVLDSLARYEANSTDAPCALFGSRGTWPAGGKTPNGTGLYDMAGNVAEWTWTTSSGNLSHRIALGGSWQDVAGNCALGVIADAPADEAAPWRGFRIARSVSEAVARAADLTSHVWTSGGIEPWYSQNGVTTDAIDTAETGSIPANGDSWLETSVVGPGILRFWWKSESLVAGDLLGLTVGGQEVAGLATDAGWTAVEIEIPEGTNEVRWSFVRGSAQPEVPARVLLDDVVYTLATEPAVVTSAASNVGGNGATLGGEATASGGRSVTERGVVWSADPAPELGVDSSIASGAGLGVFTVPVTGLLAGTTYHFRAYAKNAIGITHGGGRVFTTDTPVEVNGGIGGFDRTLIPGDRHVFRLTVDRPRVVDFSSQGTSALRVRLTRANGSPIATGDGAFQFERILSTGDYVLELFLDPVEGLSPALYHLDIDGTEIALTVPDVAVGATASLLVGSGIQTAPTSQQWVLNSRQLRPAVAVAVISNRGRLPDALKLRASAGTPLFAVVYTGLEGNITAALVAGTYTTKTLTGAAESVALAATVSPNKKKLKKKVGRRSVILKKTYISEIRATAVLAPAATDAAQIKVMTR